MASVTSGRSGRLAAMWEAQFLQDQNKAADARILQGQTDALGAINTGEPLSLAALGKGFDQARGAYGDARAMYQPYAETGLKGFNAYADATGVNGQGGYDRQFSNFRADPGYQYRVDQGTDAVARKASAMGVLGSGNAMDAVRGVAQNEADQGYNQYLSRLQGLGQVGMQATGAQAGLTKGIGDLYSTQGAAEAGIYDTNAARRAGIYGQGTNQSLAALGRTTAGVAQAGRNGMLAGQSAAANRMNLTMQGIKLGTDLLGSLMGGAPSGTGGFSNFLGKATGFNPFEGY